MKKVTITISYDEEKLSALKLYLGQKDLTTEDELTKALDTLYTKSVPTGVREFIEMRSGVSFNQNTKPKKTKVASSAVGAAQSSEVKKDE